MADIESKCAVCGMAITQRGAGSLWRAPVQYPGYSAWCYGVVGTIHRPIAETEPSND